MNRNASEARKTQQQVVWELNTFKRKWKVSPVILVEIFLGPKYRKDIFSV